MKRQTRRAEPPQPQLALPFARAEDVRDLAYYLGLCRLFAAYHKRWPGEASTRAEFRAARVSHYDGRRINRELRNPGPALAVDPDYRELRERCEAEGLPGGVDLDVLDPRFRTVLSEQDIAALFDTMTLPESARPGELRYATGLAAHTETELTLRTGENIRAQALRQAELDTHDPRVLARTFSARVRATDELIAFIHRVSGKPPASPEWLADRYLLEADDGGRLYLRNTVRAGSRYAGTFRVDSLVQRLAAILTIHPDLAELRSTAAPDGASPIVTGASARHGDEELHDQIAMLEPEGVSLKLPIQELSRFADIRRMLEKAGGIYRANRQRFDFDDGVDPATILSRLINDEAG